MTLGKLGKGDLRRVWENEAADFTNWLAREENLALLSDKIGIDIKLVKTEADVGIEIEYRPGQEEKKES